MPNKVYDIQVWKNPYHFFVKISINPTNMFQTKQFGCLTRFMISISSYPVKISGHYPLLHGFTVLNRIGEILIKKLIIILIKKLTKENY